MRLFLAIDLPEETESYIQEIQSKLDGGIRLTNSFHMTLKFLGEVSEGRKEKIIEKLDKIKSKKFELELSGLGAFPNKNDIKILWIGVKENYLLMELRQRIERELEEFNFRKDHKFYPHITLGRVNRKIKFPQIDSEEKEFLVDRFILYKSELKTAGPEYTKLKEFTLL